MNTFAYRIIRDKLISLHRHRRKLHVGLAELHRWRWAIRCGDDRSQSHSTDKLIREGIPVVIAMTQKTFTARVVVYRRYCAGQR